MKHSSLERLALLLEILRAHPALQEASLATFHLNGRGFVHFHEEAEGLFADVLLAKGRVHLAVSSTAEQAELLERIEEVLRSLEQRKVSRKRREHRVNRPPNNSLEPTLTAREKGDSNAH